MSNSKSDIGAKAAWKGFSSQTTYIAYRLMLLNDKYDFYPEKIEDLMIKNQNSIIELVQIKNLSSNLALSSFSPKEADSFFRRALASRKDDENFTLKIVSFGKIGEELQGLINKDENYINSIKNKLLEYKYSLGDIQWIFSNLSIEQVNEVELEKKIFQILEKRIETMVAPQVAFDTLISYVSDLSRYSKYTSKEKWSKKIDEYTKDIVAIKGMCSQYGRTIIKLADYKTKQSLEELTSEYQLGVNAHPQHIRNNLDIIRDEWLEQIEDCFENNNNIIIVKGASGQGKSSLAYRYLINNYPENYIFVVEKIVDSQQAIDIVAALNGLSASKSGNIIVYIDVSPYDKEWLWIVEEINKRGINLKLLITIREEDFNRSDIDLNIIRPKVIELSFGKSEARKVFEKYNSPYFLNFEQAWKKFGEVGPFMEFMYLLKQSDTLKNKLRSQISKIVNNEINSDELLNILQVICYAGKNNLKINLQRLISELHCTQTRKMLQQFQNEYLIKISSDKQYIECLHAVRAEILYDILMENSMIDEETTLLHSLASVDGFCQSMLVKYFFKHSNIDELLNKITESKFHSWTGCASIISALLWLDTYRFYLKNKQVINQGNELFSGNFLLFTGDATGYIDFDFSEIINVFGGNNSNATEKMKELISRLPQSKIDYYYTDIFINKIKAQLSAYEILSIDNLSEVGFALFWLGQRNIFLEDIACKDVVNNLSNYSVDNILDFLVGVQVQNRIEIYDRITEYLIPIICQRYNIIRLKNDKNCIEVDFIQNVFNQSLEPNNITMNERVMFVVDALRRLFLNKERYQVKAIGVDIMSDIQLPDTHKNIPSRNLPLVWITQINGWLTKIDDYEKRANNWNDFRCIVDKDRYNILNYAKKVCDAIYYFYKKEGSIEKFTSQEYKMNRNRVAQISTKIYRTPKCINDRYGLTVNKNKVMLPSVIKNNSLKDTEKDITSYVNKYITSFKNFLNQMEALVVSRYKRTELDETCRLSMINLVSSISDLIKMQNKYSEVFSIYDSVINVEDEYEQLLLLSVMWRYLYNNKIRKENSVLYNCKEIIKQSRRKIKNFFVNIIEAYTSQGFNIISSKVYISLDGRLVDDFSKQLFIQFKKEFADVEALSIGSLFLEEFAEEIIVTIPLDANTIVGGVKIELKNLIYCQEVKKYMLFRQPLDKSEVDAINNSSFDEDNIMFNVYKVIGNFHALSLIYNHTTSVMKYIKSYSKDTIIQENIFYSWHEEGVKLHCSVLEEIINAFEKLENSVPKELYETYQVILSMLNNYKEISDDVVMIEDKEQVNNVLNSMFETVIGLLDGCDFM
ncbi:hypothetical protein DVW05_09230 [Clostridium botulinum]|uniref:hypothetical protein n=1 Tax=Clostridium sp. ZBS18 TaxID=2949967 RepID=UPI001D84CCD9|nr:hypothetical protein [Clostridium sp. ZBS18]MBN1055528.1 hypothetical protein [Clostridium botulinum]